MTGSGREALLDIWEALLDIREALLDIREALRLSGNGREALPDVREALSDDRECSEGPLECPGVVGRPFRMIRSGRDALPNV